MGGAHTLQNGLPRPDPFSYIGVFSMGFFNEQQIAAYEAKNGASLDAGANRFRVVRYYCGNADFLYRSVAPIVDLLRKHGVNVEMIESTGGHTWINWRRYFKDFAPYLFK